MYVCMMYVCMYVSQTMVTSVGLQSHLWQSLGSRHRQSEQNFLFECARQQSPPSQSHPQLLFSSSQKPSRQPVRLSHVVLHFSAVTTGTVSNKLKMATVAQEAPGNICSFVASSLKHVRSVCLIDGDQSRKYERNQNKSSYGRSNTVSQKFSKILTPF